MRVLALPLSGTAAPETVLRRLGVRATACGTPPPAALIGDWFGSRAVVLPQVRIQPVRPREALQPPARQPEVSGEVPPEAVGGGWIGFLAHPDAVDRRLPVAAWGFADQVLRLDRAGQWWFEALVTDATDEIAARTAGRALEPLTGADFAGAVDLAPPTWLVSDEAAPDRDEHLKAVRACVEAIAAGEIFQANICGRFSWRFTGDPMDVFVEGTAGMRPAHAAYLTGPWGSVASFSPELFLSRQGDLVRSSPIKGTRPRRGPEDDGNARVLRESTKDIAENVMIVDLVRNDLGRVCRTGSVTVPELLTVHPAPGVWHLVSTVRGRLRPELTDTDLLAATFPPGSVTGAPKIRAGEIIAELESRPREIYTGAIGMASPIAGLSMNVAIRTLEFAGDQAWLGVGGGITADSDPEAEWRECLHKAAPIRDLLRSR